MPDFLTLVLMPSHWPTFVLITARLSGLMMTAPLWSMNTLPRALRAAITVVLAIVLLPLAPPVAAPEGVLDIPLPFLAEMAIGVVIGLAAAVIVNGASLAGETISLQMGLSLGPALAPMPDIGPSGVGQIQTMLAVFIYVSLNGHTLLLSSLADSLVTIPPGTAIDIGGALLSAERLMNVVFTSAVGVAAPVMVALLLANLALALLSRAVPQLNTMMVSLPLSIGVGLVTLGLALPLVATVLRGWMETLPLSVGETLGAFQTTGVR